MEGRVRLKRPLDRGRGMGPSRGHVKSEGKFTLNESAHT